MGRWTWKLFFMAALLSASFAALAQVTEIGGVGNIFKKRAAATPEAKAAKGTPAPKASPTPAQTPGPRGARGAQASPTPGAANQPAAAKAGNQRGPQAGKPGGQAAQAPTNTGQLRVVTKGLADSVKTRIVQYDEEALRTSGTAIILSERRYKPEH